MDTIPDFRSSILLHDDLLRSLGRMTVRFQELETTMRWVACSLVDNTDRHVGEIITNLVSFRELITKTEKLYFYRNPDLAAHPLEQFQYWIGKARYANDRRDNLVHSLWNSFPDEDGAFTRTKHSKNFNIVKENVTVEDVEKFCDDLKETSRAMITYIDDKIIKGLAEVGNEADG